MILHTYGRQGAAAAQRPRHHSNDEKRNDLKRTATMSPSSPSAKEATFTPSTPTRTDARVNRHDGLLSTPKSAESKIWLSPSQSETFAMVPDSPTRLKKKRNLVKSLEATDSGHSQLSSGPSDTLFSPKKKKQQQQQHSLEVFSAPTHLAFVPARDHSSRSLKNTYSGQRSYLADLNGQSDYRDHQQLNEHDITIKTVDNTPRPISLHDMREAGENRRFLDETDYILLGLQSSNPSLHITSLIDIASYFQEPSKLRRLKVNNMVATIFERAHSPELAGISNFITLILLHYVVHGGSWDASIAEIVHVRRVILLGLASVEPEAVSKLSDYRSKKMTPLCKEAVDSFLKTIRRELSSLLSEDNWMKDISFSILQKLEVDSLLALCINYKEENDLANVIAAVMTYTRDSQNILQQKAELLEKLVLYAERSPDEYVVCGFLDEVKLAVDTLQLPVIRRSIRVLINLTNNCNTFCRLLAKRRDLLRSMFQKFLNPTGISANHVSNILDHFDDLQLLICALLINMVEDEEAKSTIAQFGITILQILESLFTEQIKRTTKSVIAGYLAMLIVMLRDSLVTTSSSTDKAILFQTLEYFANVHNVLSMNANSKLEAENSQCIRRRIDKLLHP